MLSPDIWTLMRALAVYDILLVIQACRYTYTEQSIFNDIQHIRLSTIQGPILYRTYFVLCVYKYLIHLTISPPNALCLIFFKTLRGPISSAY